MSAIPPCSLRLYDTTLTLVAEIDTDEQVSFGRSLTGIGTFSIVINYNATYANLFQSDYFVQFGSSVHRIGIVENIQLPIDKEGKGSQKITVTGYEAKGLFARRIVIPAANSAYYSQIGPIETVIKNTVSDQCGPTAPAARQFPILSIATDQGRGATYALQAFNTKLSDELTKAAEANAPYLGFELYLDPVNKKLVLDMIPGLDRTNDQSSNPFAIFSSAMDTMQKATITKQSSGYKNAVYVGGQGDGADKTIVLVTPTSVPSGVLRREEYIDQSSLQSLMQLTAAGNAELNARAAAVFTVDAEGLVKSQLVLDTDYALGDLVNVVEYGQTFSVQITEVDEDWANNSYDLVMALGKQALTTESVLSDTASSLGQTNTSKGSLGWKTPTISYDLSSGNQAQGYGDIVNDVINIIGTINANRTLTLLQPDSASVGRKKYTVIITPQASSGGPFTVTLTTGVSGKQNVVIPIIKSADTLLSGILQFDIFVDSAGNVSSNSFLVRGSNSYGEYVKRSDKTMTCRFTSGTLSTATGGPSGGIYYTTPTVILAFPEAFSAIPWVIPTVKRGTTALTWGEVENGTTNTTVPMVVLSTSNVGSSYLSYIAEGQWIA